LSEETTDDFSRVLLVWYHSIRRTTDA